MLPVVVVPAVVPVVVAPAVVPVVVPMVVPDVEPVLIVSSMVLWSIVLLSIVLWSIVPALSFRSVPVSVPVVVSDEQLVKQGASSSAPAIA